jgi:hypothetical protein
MQLSISGWVLLEKLVVLDVAHILETILILMIWVTITTASMVYACHLLVVLWAALVLPLLELGPLSFDD